MNRWGCFLLGRRAMNRMPRLQSRAGFTLVELLVVIAADQACHFRLPKRFQSERKSSSHSQLQHGLGHDGGRLGSFQPGISNYVCNRGTDYRAYTTSRPDTYGVFMEVYSKRNQD